MKTFLRGISAVGAAFFPVFVFAADATALNSNKGIGGLARLFGQILDWAVPTLIACAVVYFLYGVLLYVIMGDDEEKKEKAKSTILYGIVGIFVMVSVFGLVKLVQNTFTGSIDSNASLTPPSLSGLTP
ncbi:MAG: hypothetical protein WCO79_01365 [bacterium]